MWSITGISHFADTITLHASTNVGPFYTSNYKTILRDPEARAMDNTTQKLAQHRVEICLLEKQTDIRL